MQIRSLAALMFVMLLAGNAPVLFADLDDERDVGVSKPPPTPARPVQPSKPPEIPGPLPNLGAPSGPRPEPKKEGSAPAEPAKPITGSSKKPGKKTDVNDKENHDSKQPINWSAKGLKGSKDAKIVDLLDDVIVTQGNVKLEANKAKVFFTEQDDVSKVEAAGNVKVTKTADLPQDRISARGNEAIFDNARRTVTLIGRAALWRGGDVVRGKQIVYNLDTGWINVDSVEGVVQPGEQPKK